MAFFGPTGTFFAEGLLGTSLDSFQVAENVTSSDISNVSTPGSSRQIVDLSPAPPIVGSPFYATHVPGTLGDGAIISQIQRIHADSYDQLFRGASSSNQFYTVEQQTLNSLQATLGDPQSGINVQYTAFQTAVSQLAANPSDTPSRANIISSAQALCNSLNSASSAIQNLQAQTLQQATATVTKVNGILDQIAALNSQIRASTAVGDSPNTFKDQRDYLIDQLSQYLSTQTAIQPDGSTLVTVNGKALVNDAIAYHLQAPIVAPSANGQPTFKVGFANDPNLQTQGDAGIPLGSGQLAAFQDLYNNKLTVYGTQLDAFALSLANETNRITQAGYDQNGAAGQALFQPITAGLAIAAGNIKCGLNDPNQVVAALASTSANSLVTALNSANNTVDSGQPIVGNTNYANPPAAPFVDTINVTTDGVTEAVAINVTAATTLDDIINQFNNAHAGVTMSFDPTGQRVIFTRDPANEDLVHRALQQQAATPTDPTFTLTDTGAGLPLFTALNATAISGVQQNNTNALGQNDNAAANSLLNMFSQNVGVPSVQTTVAIPALPPGVQNIALPAGVTNVRVGNELTIDAQPGGGPPQENVTVSAISFNIATGIETITFTTANAHGPGNLSITGAQIQTLGQAYGNTITQVGLDSATANSGVTTQTSLQTNIDGVRQGIDGINIDEETQNLIQYQNAYQAAAKTINVLDSLVNTVITNL